MSLRLAWNSPHSNRHTGVVPGERFRLLRLRMSRPARNNQPIAIGTRVLYMEEPGCVIALNIAALGRWPAHLYPFLVLLDCGLVVRCHSLDLDVDNTDSLTGSPQQSTAHSQTSATSGQPLACERSGAGTGKPESTIWY